MVGSAKGDSMAVMFLATVPPTAPLVATLSVLAAATNVPSPLLVLNELLLLARFEAILDKDVDDDDDGTI